MKDEDWSRTYTTTYHAMTHPEFDLHTVSEQIGDDSMMVFEKSHNHMCNPTDADENSFTVNGHNTSNIYISWWVMAPSK